MFFLCNIDYHDKVLMLFVSPYLCWWTFETSVSGESNFKPKLQVNLDFSQIPIATDMHFRFNINYLAINISKSKFPLEFLNVYWLFMWYICNVILSLDLKVVIPNFSESFLMGSISSKFDINVLKIEYIKVGILTSYVSLSIHSWNLLGYTVSFFHLDPIIYFLLSHHMDVYFPSNLWSIASLHKKVRLDIYKSIMLNPSSILVQIVSLYMLCLLLESTISHFLLYSCLLFLFLTDGVF